MKTKLNILTFTDYYQPGFKGGGPIRAISALIKALPNINFHILTRDRDITDKVPYENIVSGKWQPVNGAKVCYLPVSFKKFYYMAKEIFSRKYDKIYFNSLFSISYSILPLFLTIISFQTNKVLLAPRGELNPEAIKLKYAKKFIFYFFSKCFLYYYLQIRWHATCSDELYSIQKWVGSNVKILQAGDLFETSLMHNIKQPLRDKKNLKIVFLSRITPIKNLIFALKVIENISQLPIEFDIYGPITDLKYWNACQIKIKDILTTSNCKINYLGTVENCNTINVFQNYDLFLFPSLGENFGYVIAESLAAGCSVLTSDATPWRGFKEAGIGETLNLKTASIENFTSEILKIFNYSDQEHNASREKCRSFLINTFRDPELIRKSKNLFAF